MRIKASSAYFTFLAFFLLFLSRFVYSWFSKNSKLEERKCVPVTKNCYSQAGRAGRRFLMTRTYSFFQMPTLCLCFPYRRPSGNDDRLVLVLGLVLGEAVLPLLFHLPGGGLRLREPALQATREQRVRLQAKKHVGVQIGYWYTENKKRRRKKFKIRNEGQAQTLVISCSWKGGGGACKIK